MLIVSRKDGQSVFIGDGVQVTVLGHDSRGTKLGIEAPADVPILREELRPAPLIPVDGDQLDAIESQLNPATDREWEQAKP